MTTPPAPPTVVPDAGEAGTLVVEGPRFAIVPEWMIDSPIPDAGFRLYSLLLRYGNSSGTRMPSRATLAHRLRRSVDAVDRACDSWSRRTWSASSTDVATGSSWRTATTCVLRARPAGVAAHLRLPPRA